MHTTLHVPGVALRWCFQRLCCFLLLCAALCCLLLPSAASAAVPLSLSTLAGDGIMAHPFSQMVPFLPWRAGRRRAHSRGASCATWWLRRLFVLVTRVVSSQEVDATRQCREKKRHRGPAMALLQMAITDGAVSRQDPDKTQTAACVPSSPVTCHTALNDRLFCVSALLLWQEACLAAFIRVSPLFVRFCRTIVAVAPLYAGVCDRPRSLVPLVSNALFPAGDASWSLSGPLSVRLPSTLPQPRLHRARLHSVLHTRDEMG